MLTAIGFIIWITATTAATAYIVLFATGRITKICGCCDNKRKIEFAITFILCIFSWYHIIIELVKHA